MLNKTGADSVKGTIVSTTSTYDAVDVNPADAPKPIGVVFDDGVPDGQYMYVVFSGIALILLQDNTTATSGYWVKVSDTQAGRADATNQFPPGGTITAIEDHLSEVGHCMENVTAGIDQMAKCVVHFN